MNEFIKELKSKLPISEVVGEYVRLKKAGSNFMGLCPFHSERSASFSVSDKKGIYHCFGCQKSGDQISFIQEIQGVSFVEAIRLLSVKVGIALPKEFSQKNNQQVEDAKEIFYKLNHFVAQFYHQKLLSEEGKKALKYFESRGISEETIKKNCLGFASDSWSDLYDFLESKKAPLDKAEQLGLIRRKNETGSGRHYYDFFRNRILFPIIDMRGRVVAFGGRKMGEEDGPKYLNSSESLIFKKGHQFYGIFHALKDIRAEDTCVVVEGFMDCLKLQQEGIPYVVATLGTALGEKQVVGMKRFTQNIILVFDGDKAGVAAQEKAMETCLETGLVVRGVSLPDTFDPDEFVHEKGSKAFLELLQKAPYLLDEKIKELAQLAMNSTEEKSRALEKVLPWIAKLESDTARLLRVEEIAKLFNVDQKNLERRIKIPPVNMTNEVNIRPVQIKNTVQKQVVKKIENYEHRFLELLVQKPSRCLIIEDEVAFFYGFSDLIIQQVARNLFDKATEAARQNLDFEFSSDVLKITENARISSILARALVTLDEEKGKQKDTPDSVELDREFKDLVAKLIRRGKEKHRDELKVQILKTEKMGDQIELQRLMSEYTQLVKSLEHKT